MTWPNPPQLPGEPRTWPLTVPLKSCCGLLVGDVCNCACLITEARIVAALSEPILLPAHSSVPCLTDPALNVWRPGPDMVEAMSPPIRWTVTADGVEVGL